MKEIKESYVKKPNILMVSCICFIPVGKRMRLPWRSCTVSNANRGEDYDTGSYPH